MSITIEHVSKSYGEQVAVDDVSFSIPVGQTCGFLGPNGAGKSTLMKIMTGFIQADVGVAKINNIDVAEQPILAKMELGYLPEHNPLYLTMYVREFLEFCARIFHIQKKSSRIEEVIEQTGLGSQAHKLIGQLSKGYKQRVGLAQALLHNPSVLILDEPLNGLDPNQLVEIRELIRELGKEKTVLFSSHILQEVEQIANRIILIQHGAIVHDSINEPPNNVNTSIRIELEKTPKEEFLSKLKEIAPFQQHGNLILLQTSGVEARKEIFLLAKQQNEILITLDEQQSNLTDIFKEKTKL